MARPAPQTLDQLREAVDFVGRHGHEITAAEAPVHAAYPALAVALLLGVVAVVVVGVVRGRQGDTSLRRWVADRLQVPWLRTYGVAPLAGLALATLLFPQTVREVGTAANHATRAALVLAPQAIDAGSRCAVAPLGADDGCASHGALALAHYPTEALVLVGWEGGLARPGVVPDEDARKAGLVRAFEEERWGLRWTPFTAEHLGSPDGPRRSSGLDLATLLLFAFTVVAGGMGWILVQPVLAASGVDLDDPTQRERWPHAVRFRNFALYGVLLLGAYLSFAALSAIGPFLEAQELAVEGADNPAEQRMAEISEQWEGYPVGVQLPGVDDLDLLQSTVQQYRELRSVQVADLEGRKQELAARLQEEQAVARQEAERLLAGLGAPTQEDDAVAKAVAAAEAVKRRLAQAVELDPAKAAAHLDALSKDVTALEKALGGLGGGEEEAAEGPAESPAGRADLRTTFLSPTTHYLHGLEDARRENENQAHVVTVEVNELLRAVAEHRSRRAQVGLDHDRLPHRMQAYRIHAWVQVRGAQTEFGAIQRAGPAWLDRQATLTNWFEQAFSLSAQQVESCASENVLRAVEHRRQLSEIIRSFGAKGASKAGGLARFRAALLDSDAADAPPLACLSDDLSDELQVPARMDAQSRYGATFGLLSGWLLQSGTLDVVLVAGMLGFGLLGAGLSRVVRRRLLHEWAEDHAALSGQRAADGPRRPRPIVENVPSILFEGLGATLVVYLAGVGGLGAISMSPPELDPYVLMLACFVAAVFSDHVWRFVQGWVKREAERRTPGAPAPAPLPDE